MTTRVFVRRPDGTLEDQIETFAQLNAIPRFNNVGSWSIKAPTTDLALLLASPGYGIVVENDALPYKTLISGPTTMKELAWDGDNDYVIASGLSDLVAASDRTANPSTFPFTSDAYDDRSGVCETVLKGYASYNLGDVTRKVPAVAAVQIAPDLARGSNVMGSARMDVLLTLMQDLAIAGGGLGFDIKNLIFDCYVPADRTKEAFFSRESGNLVKVDFKQTSPTATRVYVAGGGEGTARVFVKVEDNVLAAKWGRHIEKFLDQRQTSDTGELTQAGNVELAKSGESTSLSLVPIDVPNRTYGINYHLGDRATAEGIEGTITEVHLTLDENGQTIAPTLDASSASARYVLRAFDELRKLRTRVLNLERTH